MRKIKRDIVEKYGAEPTIGYYYYSLNPTEYVGEEQVRKSFDSVKQHGENVIIGDYSSTDNIKEIVEEYGFTFLTIEKTPEIFFHEPKIANKIIKEAPQNFLCYLNFWIHYPENFSNFLINWLNNNNGKTHYLKMTGYAMYPDGKLFKTNHLRPSHSVSTLLYRPFLYEAHGYDERTTYNAGTRNYAVGLMTRVFGLDVHAHFFPFIHANHKRIHLDKVTKNQKKEGFAATTLMLGDLSRRFYRAAKKVKNSYW